MTTLRLRKRWKDANDDALFGAVSPYRMAAFWKEAFMAKALHLLGFGDRKVKNPPTLKSSGYSETWLRADDAEA